MSLVDSLKKGLFGSEDEYEDQYIDDGPQMVNNNNGVGLGADDETEEPAEGAKKNKVVNIHACLLYTSDAADEEDSVALGGSRIIKKKKYMKQGKCKELIKRRL